MSLALTLSMARYRTLRAFPLRLGRSFCGLQAAEIGVGFFARYQQKVTIRKSLAARKVNLLLAQAQRSGVGGMGVAMEIGQNRDVDSQSPKYGHPRRFEIQRSGVGQFLIEVEMEMADQHLESRHGLVD